MTERTSWLNDYPEKETLQITACRVYKQQFAGAGLPGHALMLIIAHMADQLDALSRTAPQETQGPRPTPISAARTAMASEPANPPAQPQQPPQPAVEGQNYKPRHREASRGCLRPAQGQAGAVGRRSKGPHRRHIRLPARRTVAG